MLFLYINPHGVWVFAVQLPILLPFPLCSSLPVLLPWFPKPCLVLSVCYSLSNDTFPAGAVEVNSPKFHVCSLAGVCHGAGAAALAGNPALPLGLGVSKHTHCKCTCLKPVSISLHWCTISLLLFVINATSWKCYLSGGAGVGFTSAGCYWLCLGVDPADGKAAG